MFLLLKHYTNKTSQNKKGTLLNKCLIDTPPQKKVSHKGNYALINVFMKPKSQDPSLSLGEFHPVPELYSLLLWRAQFPHASYPREQLLDKFLEEIRRS